MVGLRRISPGAFVDVGAEIVTLVSIDPIKLDFRVPEVFLARVREGQKIAVSVDAFPGRSFPDRSSRSSRRSTRPAAASRSAPACPTATASSARACSRA